MSTVVTLNNLKKLTMKRTYEQPQIEVFDIRIEKGFAQTSGVNMGIDGWGPGGEYDGPAD